MESLVIALAEKTVLGAGFFYLLIYLVKNLNIFADVLKEISETLLKIDMRMSILEERVRDLEIEKGGVANV